MTSGLDLAVMGHQGPHQLAYLSVNLTSSSVPKTRPDLGFTKWALWQTEHLIGTYRQKNHRLLLRSTPARGDRCLDSDKEKHPYKSDHGLLARVLIQDNSMRFSDPDLI
jgi:hypothetical protein